MDDHQACIFCIRGTHKTSSNVHDANAAGHVKYDSHECCKTKPTNIKQPFVTLTYSLMYVWFCLFPPPPLSSDLSAFSCQVFWPIMFVIKQTFKEVLIYLSPQIKNRLKGKLKQTNSDNKPNNSKYVFWVKQSSVCFSSGWFQSTSKVHVTGLPVCPIHPKGGDGWAKTNLPKKANKIKKPKILIMPSSPRPQGIC